MPASSATPNFSPWQRQLLAELHRRGLLSAADAPMTFPQYVDAVRPRYVWYRHAVALAEVLQRVADDELKRVLVLMAPRDGKSELVSRLFTGYYLYRHPGRWVGLCSYGAELAYTLSRAARERHRLAGGAVQGDAAAVKHWETPHGGGLWAAGVGGPITGKGFHLGVIDDAVKNYEEASSAAIQARNRDWYTSTFLTREEPIGPGDPHAAIVVVGTRWHEADLIGWLLAQEGQAEYPERWHVVHFEAIKEATAPPLPTTCTIEPDWRRPGEALCPQRRPIEKLEAIRSRDPHAFAALFQQRPAPAEGDQFKAHWLRYWDRPPATPGTLVPTIRLRTVPGEPAHDVLVPHDQMTFFGSLDTANSLRKTADYSVVALWGVTPRRDLVLLDLSRGRRQEPELLAHIHELRAGWTADGTPPAYFVAGTGGGGAQVLQHLRSRGVAGVAVDEVVDKLARSTTARVQMQAGKVYVPAEAPWLGEFKRELLLFPNGAHDDQVDALSHAANQAFSGQVAFGEPTPVDIVALGRWYPGGPRDVGVADDVNAFRPGRGPGSRRLHGY